MMLRLVMIFPAAILAAPSNAVPPPAPRSAAILALKTDNCPVEISGTARPYSPQTYRFIGKADDVLIVANRAPSLNLAFNLGIANESPWIINAGLGSEVRVRLPRSGTYELQVSGFDQVRMQGVAENFRLKLYLRDQKPLEACRTGQ